MNILAIIYSFFLFAFTFDYWKIFYLIEKCILRTMMLILGCIMYPIIRMRLKKHQYCPPLLNRIFFWTATDIARKIRMKEITSEEVVSTFIARCKEVNPILNAIVEDNYKNALKEARAVDYFLNTTTQSIEYIAKEMPLFGVPVTIKASIAVKDFSIAVGVTSEKHIKAKKNAHVVRKIREAGGIILLTSNTPELCMFWETFNNIIGRTSNPYDTRRTTGGSTGGEAALISSGASLMGLASDVAGSIRLPAMFCGIFGHKPTSYWISCEGHRPIGTNKKWNNTFTIGVMTRYAIDLPLILRSITTSKECMKCLDRQVDIGEIKIFYLDDKYCKILGSSIEMEIKLAINNLTNHLKLTYQCQVQKVELKNLKYAMEIGSLTPFELNKTETIFNLNDGTKPWKSVFLVLVQRLFNFNSHTWGSILYGILVRFLEILPASFYKDILKKRSLLKKELEQLLHKNAVLICPTFHACAHYHSEIYYKFLNIAYMNIFNSLSLPVTQCPMGLNRNGLPIGLQIIANDSCDHLTIALAKEIEKQFGGWQVPPSNINTVT
ncbi:fatty-acid amide hydrolase 2-A-like isoform X1 [Vespa velutina]|uniref:fatty-acid amide hydrolase 2-A-like isoform X1 n=1 Tax=Vespa velutina TaxID=202808 RepID=UPI001FB3C49A|nr:fatty-acid amide hydrolase 2-A-like isoform X1 [Vespa velutina]XP_047348463.1 fatty-acid amide hydrolase 2-A-like isoform X1 [Vespa velutina]